MAIAWKDVAPVSPHEDIASFSDSYGCGYLDAPQVPYDTTLYITQLALVQLIERPFHSVADPLYIEEVKISHPNVHVPSPRRITLIYCGTDSSALEFPADVGMFEGFPRQPKLHQVLRYDRHPVSDTSKLIYHFCILNLCSTETGFMVQKSSTFQQTRPMSSHEMFYPAKFTPPMKWWLLKILCAKFLYVWRMTPHCGLSRFVGPLTTWLSDSTWLLVHDTVVLFVALSSWHSSFYVFAADTKVLKVSLFPIDVAQRQVFGRIGFIVHCSIDQRRRDVRRQTGNLATLVSAGSNTQVTMLKFGSWFQTSLRLRKMPKSLKAGIGTK
ncbi:hypothetical protein C8R48DRAFT_677758 [Suillus tomentosus]|nr:hypothetical protein C8R48DRAFT_677758 [Suillus tomentosus]